MEPPIKLTHIDLIPVWASQCGDLEGKEDVIVLFDMYLKDGTWIGSKRTFIYCKEINNDVKSEI